MDSRLLSGCARVASAITLCVACGDISSANDQPADDAAAPRDATLDVASRGTFPSDAASDGSATDGGRDPTDAHLADVVASPPDGGDGEADAPGPVSDPGRIACGGGTCDTTIYELCCSTPGGEGGTEHCTKDPSGCAWAAQCNEKADCWAGTVCCAGPSSAGGQWRFSRSCLAVTAGVCELNGGFQLCKTDAECGGSTCTVKTCASGMFASCGPLPAWYPC